MVTSARKERMTFFFIKEKKSYLAMVSYRKMVINIVHYFNDVFRVMEKFSHGFSFLYFFKVNRKYNNIFHPQ